MNDSAGLDTRISAAVLAGWAVVVLVLTLHSVDASREPTTVGEATHDVDAIDWVANVVLFVPGGFLGASLAGGPVAVLGGGVLSAAVETTQNLVPGRWSRAGDVVANTTGALAGVLLWFGYRRLRLRPERILSRLELVFWMLLLAGHVSAVVLWSPSPSFAKGTWSASLASESRLGLPAGSARVSFDERETELQETLVADSAAGRRELVRAYRLDRALVLRARVSARDLGFLQRSLRVEGVFPEHDTRADVAGDVVLQPGKVHIHVRSPVRRHASARWSVDDLWALVVPAGRMGSTEKVLLQWIFAVSLTAPVFLLATLSGAGAPGIIGRLVVLVALLALLPPLFGQPLFGPRLFAATGGGAGAGSLAGGMLKEVLGKR